MNDAIAYKSIRSLLPKNIKYYANLHLI